jgi:Zn-finger nucleic acid-binding protein
MIPVDLSSFPICDVCSRAESAGAITAVSIVLPQTIRRGIPMETPQCPKCKAPMEQVQIEQTQVDRCTSCRGLWFDALEDQDIRETEAAQTLDIPASGLRAEPAKTRRSSFDCPRCKSPMIQMVDRMGRRIQYESCPQCHGKFLDAGEFKALEPRGVKATMRRLLKGKQRKG